MISTCASANLDTSPNPIQRDSIGALVSSISYYQKYIRIHLCISIKGLYLHIENFPPRLLYYHQHQKIINLFFLIQNPINLKKFWIPPLVPMWITPPLVSWLVWHLCLLSSVLYFSCLPSKQENQSRNRIQINSQQGKKILHVASNLVQKCETHVCVSARSTNRLSTFWNPFGAGQEWASTTHIPLCE